MRPPNHRAVLLLIGWTLAAITVFAALVWFDRLLQPDANLPAAAWP
jgi:hypothetical protein